MGLSTDTRFNYFLIFCDHYSQLFRICGIQDKSTDAYIDGIELIYQIYPFINVHHKPYATYIVTLDLNSDQILLENGVVKIKFNSTPQPQNIKNKMV